MLIMNNEELFLGSHVSMSGPDYYLGSVKEALSYGSNTFMFYTGAPQNTIRLPLEKLKIEEGRQLIKSSGLDESKIVVHAPYLINIANQLNEETYELSKRQLLNELKRTYAFGPKVLVLHPGSHVKTGVENGIDSIVNALDEVLSDDGTDVKIALETMAGKGSEMGTSFNELKEILNRLKFPERVGICMDTCHIDDAGYDVKNIDNILKEFDSIIGLDKLLVVHVNDSKNPLGAHKDRHENIGYGFLGFETLYKVVHHPLLKGIPMILETPYFEGNPPYKKEIEMLRVGRFEDWKAK